MKVELLGWLDSPEQGRGTRYLQEDGDWERYTWADVAGHVHEASAQIAEHRREAGGPVAIVLPNTPEFLAAFFGALHAGNVPCPLAPPNPLQNPDAYVRHLCALLEVADPSLVLTSDQYLPLVADALSTVAPGRRPHVLRVGEERVEARRGKPSELALMQFTSGSSGRPRAARVSWSNLEANIQMMADCIYVDVADDHGVTWLPHYHDMGLIGGLLSAATTRADVRIMRPEQFVRRPRRWLECFGLEGCTIGGCPTFGFVHVLRRVKPDQLVGLDFSRWRATVVGAERIDAAVLSRFVDLLEPFGYQASSLLPGYGLAEATLCVSWRFADTAPVTVRPSWESLRFGEPVAIEEHTVVGDTHALGDGTGWLVSCGWPQRGVGLSVVGEEGQELSEGHLGELFVTGPCVVSGYHGPDDVGTARFADGGVRTGDAGFFHDGELYVLGRIGDSLKVRGRAVYVEDLEARVGQLPGVEYGRCAIFSGTDVAGSLVVVLVESPEGDFADAVIGLLADELGDDVRIEVLAGRPGAIARTSSGKPRRRVMWRSYVEGTLAATTVATAGPAPGSAVPGGAATKA